MSMRPISSFGNSMRASRNSATKPSITAAAFNPFKKAHLSQQRDSSFPGSQSLRAHAPGDILHLDAPRLVRILRAFLLDLQILQGIKCKMPDRFC